VGSELCCLIPLGGQTRTLRARVARLQPLDDHRVGIGMAFVELAPSDRALLDGVVAGYEAPAELVSVRFDGVRPAAASRAVITDDGVELRTALPFLRIDSSVEVAFGSGGGRVVRHGVLRDVRSSATADGAPYLAVSVRLQRPTDRPRRADEDDEPPSQPARRLTRHSCSCSCSSRPPRRQRSDGSPAGVRRSPIPHETATAPRLALLLALALRAARTTSARRRASSSARPRAGDRPPPRAPAVAAAADRSTATAGAARPARQLEAALVEQGGAVPGRWCPPSCPAEVVYPVRRRRLCSPRWPPSRGPGHHHAVTRAGRRPAGLRRRRSEDVDRALAAFRDDVRRLSYASHSKTTNLLGFRKEVLPDQLAFALMALAAFDCQPVALRYFRIEDDGSCAT
jgi:hypothetical protein